MDSNKRKNQKTSTFERELAAALEPSVKKIDPNATQIIPTDLESPLEESEYDRKRRLDIQEKAKQQDALEKYQKQQQQNMQDSLERNKRSNLKLNDSPDIDPSGTRSLHKSTNQASQEAIDWAKNQQALGQKQRTKQEVRDKQLKLEEDVAQRKKFELKQPAKELASQSLEKPSRFSRILKALGMRGSKAIPFLGAGMGALSAKEALAKGDKLGAALETASMVDPTPISDIVLAGKDIYDIVTEKDDTEKTMKPMIKAIGGEPDMNPKKADELAGEQDSPDSDAASAGLNILNEQTRRQKKLGYNF
jgi:hypothetical protein